MNKFTEQIENLAELQKKGLEPFNRFNTDALAAFEQVARKNHELMGDMVEFAVAQSRNQVEGDTPQAIYEKQVAEARAFAERISTRAAEYAELANQFKENTVQSASDAVASARSQATSGAKKAAPKPATAKAATANKAATAKKPTAKKTGSKEAASSKAASKADGAKKSASKAAASKTRASRTSAKATAKKGATRRKVGRKAG